MSVEFVLSRAGVPVLSDGSPLHDSFDWDWAVAWPFAALASPRAAARMPAQPDFCSSEPTSAALGYWNCLAYLLTYSLGWTRHDRGLRWWYDQGKPIDDARLSLVNTVWGNDGTLDRYLEWSHDRTFHVPDGLIGSSIAPKPDDLSADWQQKMREIRLSNSSSLGSSSPGQPHGFHLEMGTHIGAAMEANRAAKVLVDPENSLHMIVIVPNLVGWYESLRKSGASLVASVGSSLRVSVYATSDGYLGTYRRSWETGLWFAGKHRYHAAGN